MAGGAIGVLIVVLLLVAVGLKGIHQVPEGFVGVYWRGGRLLNSITFPGIHFIVPIIDSAENVQITMQTDSVTDIPCGTSGGVVIHFDRIEVVNRLHKDKVLTTIRDFGVNYDKMWIFDKIHHEINQFCSSHTLREVFIEQFDTLDESLQKALQTSCDKYGTGIDIITVRVTKPRIPESVRKNYELIEAERTNVQLALERQKVAEREAQTDAMRAKIAAEKAKTVREIQVSQEIMEREGAQKVAKITDEMYLHQEQTRTDAAFYRETKEAEANAKRFTPEFLKYTMLIAISNNTKIFFGERIPNMFSGLLSPDVLNEAAAAAAKQTGASRP